MNYPLPPDHYTITFNIMDWVESRLDDDDGITDANKKEVAEYILQNLSTSPMYREFEHCANWYLNSTPN